MSRKSPAILIYCAYCGRLIARTTLRSMMHMVKIVPLGGEYITDLQTIGIGIVKYLRKRGIVRCPHCHRELKLVPLLDRARVTMFP